LYYAHSTKTADRSDWQLLGGHLRQVALRAAAFGAKFGATKAAALAGWLHDLGKYSEAYQAYIGGRGPGGVDHSTAGAQEVMKLASRRQDRGRRLLHGGVDRNHRSDRAARGAASRLLRGGVVETPTVTHERRASQVASFTGAWIETCDESAASLRVKHRPSAGPWDKTVWGQRDRCFDTLSLGRSTQETSW
jgi:hypothetical protein